MAQSIKISDAEMTILREESKLFGRSLAGQVEHWIRLGRSIESSPHFDYQKIRDALASKVSADDLNLEEQVVYFDKFFDAMGKPTPEQEAFFEERRKKGLGVGLDENDNFVYQSTETS